MRCSNRHRLDRSLDALRALGGSATLAQIARKADLERETTHSALLSLAERRLVEPKPWGTRALRDGSDNADRMWRLL
jgi:DNA-binding IclR family transcriptional regulator